MSVIWNWTRVILIIASIHSKMYRIKITQNVSCIQLNFQCYTSDAFVLFFLFLLPSTAFISLFPYFFFFLMNFGITSLIVHPILIKTFALLSLIHSFQVSLFPFAEKQCFIFGLPELRFLLPKTCYLRLYLCHFIVKICLHLYVKNY